MTKEQWGCDPAKKLGAERDNVENFVRIWWTSVFLEFENYQSWMHKGKKNVNCSFPLSFVVSRPLIGNNLCNVSLCWCEVLRVCGVMNRDSRSLWSIVYLFLCTHCHCSTFFCTSLKLCASLYVLAVKLLVVPTLRTLRMVSPRPVEARCPSEPETWRLKCSGSVDTCLQGENWCCDLSSCSSGKPIARITWICWEGFPAFIASRTFCFHCLFVTGECLPLRSNGCIKKGISTSLLTQKIVQTMFSSVLSEKVARTRKVIDDANKWAWNDNCAPIRKDVATFFSQDGGRGGHRLQPQSGGNEQAEVLCSFWQTWGGRVTLATFSWQTVCSSEKWVKGTVDDSEVSKDNSWEII